MNNVIFFAQDCHSGAPPVVPELPRGMTLRILWSHGPRLMFRQELSFAARLKWTVLYMGRGLREQELGLVSICSGRRCVHRTLIVPAFFRFPFMAHDDLQVGDIWTDPEYRGRGVAAAGVSSAVTAAWKPKRRIWFLTETSNSGSQRLAQKCGFTLTAMGKRTQLFGIRFLGQFVVTWAAESVR